MGLLDDAIREHLDLKRRRGADPAEIERAEQEALGPVRREPIGSGEARQKSFPERPPTAGEEIFLDPAVERFAPAEPFDQHEDDAERGNDEQSDDFDGEHADDEEAHDHPEAVRHPPSMLPGEPPTASRQPSDDSDAGRGDTMSYDVHEAHTEHSKESDNDVLEETPEFLQDTPDHDRLWFEQRPPRDFDFDE